MMPPSEWLKPPRSLLLILFLVTLVSVSALAWFGWRVLYQEQVVETQRAQERLEQAADRITATARGVLAETGERVGNWPISPPADGKPDDGLVLILNGNNVSARPAERLLYRPFPTPEPEAPPASFSQGEALEFQQNDPAKAIEWYRRLTENKDDAVRAGALLRLARVLRKSGRSPEARDVYTQLAAIGGAAVAGVPADLVARHELCELSGRIADALALQSDLLRARWQLTRGQFAFYWSEAGRLAGREAPAPASLAAWSEAAARVWADLRRDAGPRGQNTFWVDGRAFFLIWRGVAGRRAALLTLPESLLKPVLAGSGVACAALDSEGRVLAGQKGAAGHAAGHAVVRSIAETQLPWVLYFTGVQGATDAGMVARQRFLMLVTVVTVLFLIAGAYFIARAVRRDLEVSRMQSDFVSAVSHEFRSPLTSIRQLSELLAEGRVPGQERRQIYYETLVRESTRLQRLVEALLNFGRMEAGVRKYRFEEMDAASLVEKVVGEFAPQVAATGRHIELEAAAGVCPIDADPEALSVALRNLVDNALKYSPGCPTVWVQWGAENAHVAIRVRDRGVGIPAFERRAIFRKFFRGTAAATANVKGSGVGLAMVRHIVAAHGGEISVVSEPGEGSTFTILLPAGESK